MEAVYQATIQYGVKAQYLAGQSAAVCTFLLYRSWNPAASYEAEIVEA